MKKLRILLFASSILTVIVVAHVYEVSQGIHFKGTPVDFGEAPRRERLYDPVEYDNNISWGWRPGTTYLLGSDAEPFFDGNREARTNRDQRLCAAAENAALAGRYRRSLAMFRDLLAHGHGDPGFLFERIEVLKQAIAANDLSGLAAYLRGRDSHSLWLQPYIRYDAATRQELGLQRAIAFEKIAQDFPNSSRVEPAMMMAARDHLRPSIGADDPEVTKGRRLIEA